MEIDYNTKAFIYVVVLAISGIILMIIGYYLPNPHAFIIGGILFLVSTLVTIVLTGIIFAMRMYSEDSALMENQEQK